AGKKANLSPYKEKKVKVNVINILFPYKKIENEIVHKSLVRKVTLQKTTLCNYDIHSIFKSEESETKSRDNSQFPRLTHHRNYSEVSVKSLKTPKSTTRKKA